MAGPDFRPPRGVPIPDANPSGVNPRVRIPDESPTLPHRRAKDKGPVKPSEELWTFQSGGSSGDELHTVALLPIELPTPKPITLQLYEDTSLRGEVRVVQEPPFTWTVTDPVSAGVGSFEGENGFGVGVPGNEQITLNAADIAFPASSTQIRVNKYLINGTSGDNLLQDMQVKYPDGAWPDPTYVRIDWNDGTPGSESHAIWTIAEASEETGGFAGGYFNALTLNPETSQETVPLAEGMTVALRIYRQTPAESIHPNAAIRARIKYSAGKAEDIEFECDWSGSIHLMASRVELSRVTVRPDPMFIFEPRPVKLSGIALVNGTSSPVPPRLTVPTAHVAIGATLTVPIPPLARRVSLMALYGADPMLPGDAPLGQLFVTFIGTTGNGLSFIDAMAAREALFGEGLPIPIGAVDVGLTNRSEDPTIRLGVVWHLGL